MPSLAILASSGVITNDDGSQSHETSILLKLPFPDDILRPYVLKSIQSHPEWTVISRYDMKFVVKYEDVYTAYTANHRMDFWRTMVSCPWGTRPLEENIDKCALFGAFDLSHLYTAPHFTKCVEIIIDHKHILSYRIPELMYYLSVHGDVKTVEMLLLRGYDPNYTHLGWSTLDVAKGDEMKRVLVAGGARSGPGVLGMVADKVSSLIGAGITGPNLHLD